MHQYILNKGSDFSVKQAKPAHTIIMIMIFQCTFYHFSVFTFTFWETQKAHSCKVLTSDEFSQCCGYSTTMPINMIDSCVNVDHHLSLMALNIKHVCFPSLLSNRRGARSTLTVTVVWLSGLRSWTKTSVFQETWVYIPQLLTDNWRC